MGFLIDSKDTGRRRRLTCKGVSSMLRWNSAHPGRRRGSAEGSAPAAGTHTNETFTGDELFAAPAAQLVSSSREWGSPQPSSTAARVSSWRSSATSSGRLVSGGTGLGHDAALAASAFCAAAHMAAVRALFRACSMSAIAAAFAAASVCTSACCAWWSVFGSVRGLYCMCPVRIRHRQHARIAHAPFCWSTAPAMSRAAP